MNRFGNRRVAVVGAGPVGSYQAMALKDMGVDPQVYEMRSDPREAGLTEGKSVNLALSHRGLTALDELGLAEPIERILVPMHGRFLHVLDDSGQPVVDATHSYGDALQSVHRGRLAQFMVQAAEDRGVDINFDSKVVRANLDHGILDLERDGKPFTAVGEHIFAADGSNSAIRQVAESAVPCMFKDGRKLFHVGYKEFNIPATAAGGFRLENHNGFHIWPRGEHMFIALPNQDGSFTCTLFMPLETKQGRRHSFESLSGDEQAFEAFFTTEFPDLAEVVNEPWEQFSANDGRPALMHTVDARHWNYMDHFILMGDAAHGVVPFYGQGLNIGLESARMLNEAIRERTNVLMRNVFADYVRARKPQTDAVAAASIYNCKEMAELTVDPIFRACRQLEALFNTANPGQLIDLHYDMTFTSKPQDKLWQRSRAEEQVLKDALKQFPDLMDSLENTDSLPEDVEQYIKDRLVL